VARNPLAGLKAKVLYRNLDGSSVLQVEDPNDEVLLSVDPDGSMSEYRIVGFGAGVGEAWEATAPGSGAMRVPDDAGRKVWTHLEPEPVAEPKPAPAKPEPTAPVPVSRDPQYEPYKPPRDNELTRRMAWGPGWDL
jgi:hypothetical protein